ncbi:hypothetical protein HPB50_006543 [Hyalomma asiaticum]|uniref:Uncharacterized protein n=1 Tax=Hyalomma asiaticum TaxID=266040 RepID=A0ACB7T3R7_HYAAI|nr:hypothetical protein HPB50_006543 [Hyalomma asiaticum]
MWSNLDENLGSHHYIISASISSPKLRRVTGDVAMTDSVSFENHALPENVSNDVSGWAAIIRERHKATSKKITRTTEALARITALSEEASKYAAKLATDGWVQFCGSLRGTLGTSRTWAILRAMLEPEKSKSATSRTLQRIVHDYPGTDEERIEALKERYVGTDDVPPCDIQYTGTERADLDTSITKEEVFAAAQAADRNSAPGLARAPDEIPYLSYTLYADPLGHQGVVGAKRATATGCCDSPSVFRKK